MKKLLICFYGLLFLAAAAGTSVAVPFQVTGSALAVNWSSGGGWVNYTPYAMSDPIDLGDGESTDFTFGRISFPLAWGEGTADLTINFSMPLFDNGSVTDLANFRVRSGFFFSGGNLTFGGPESFNYTHKDSPGGVMTLALFDVSGIQRGHAVDVIGRITNSTSPIPEPATMFLMGAGLLGLAAVGRKKIRAS